jgi:hypothetical protein
MGRSSPRVASETRPPPQAEPEIPENWKEVASIDFTGYLDRDCEERIIYKTPEGTLKAQRSRSLEYDEPSVIENVKREQVVK